MIQNLHGKKDTGKYRILIVGGVAGGASCAARARRLSEEADIDITQSIFLDVREPDEFEKGHVAGAISIPLGALRQRIPELPRDSEILSYCGVGQRSHYATRILRLNKFKARNVSGGFTSYKMQKT